MAKKIKQFPNFQDLYSFQDYKLVKECQQTFSCGFSPICLWAPLQHAEVNKGVLKEKDSHSALLSIRTLKLEYAIQVWIKAALISADNPGPLLYYWWLHYEDNGTAFREVRYSKNWWGATPENMNKGFWDLLEKIADSGEIFVHEGFSYNNKTGYLINEPDINFKVVLDLDNAKDAYKIIDDVFTHPYDLTPRTFNWSEIKNFFIQLSLKQLSLVDEERLHKHSRIDEILYTACDNLDFEAVKTAIRMGADVNSLDKRGESALSHAVEYFNDHGKIMDRKYSEEEELAIEKENYIKCVQIIDYLLDLGADIDLFGVDGMQPVTHAYYTHSVEMVKHLLEKGADPNYNSYRCDDLWGYSDDSHKCTILEVIGNDLSEEYDDQEKEMESLVRQYGGRRYDWDYDVARWNHLGKFYLTMSPTNEKFIFFDNDGWGMGDENAIIIEDENANQTQLKLKPIAGLREWHEEYLRNTENPDFDWNEWNKRGYKFAHLIAQQLPDTVALYYPYGENVELLYDGYSKKHYLKHEREEIRIYPSPIK